MQRNWKHASSFIGTAVLAAAAFYGVKHILRRKRCIVRDVAEFAESSLAVILEKRNSFVHWLQQANENHGQLNFKYKMHLSQHYERVYDYLRSVENFSKIVPELARVEAINASRSVYRIHTQVLGNASSYYLFIVKDRPNAFLGWSAATDTLFYNTGKFELHPDEDLRGTTLDCVVSITPPGGAVGLELLKPFYALIYRRVARCLKRMRKEIEADSPALSSS